MDPYTRPQSFKDYYKQSTGFTEGELKRISDWLQKRGFELWYSYTNPQFGIVGNFPSNHGMIHTSKELSFKLLKEVLNGTLNVQRLLECYAKYWKNWKKYGENPVEQDWVEKFYFSRMG